VSTTPDSDRPSCKDWEARSARKKAIEGQFLEEPGTSPSADYYRGLEEEKKKSKKDSRGSRKKDFRARKKRLRPAL